MKIARLNPVPWTSKGPVTIYGGVWYQRQNGWANKILSKRLGKTKNKTTGK